MDDGGLIDEKLIYGYFIPGWGIRNYRIILNGDYDVIKLRDLSFWITTDDDLAHSRDYPTNLYF